MVKAIVVGFMVSVVVMAIVAVGAIIVTQRTNNAACESSNDLRHTLTKIITRSQTLASTNREYTQAQKNTAAIFYSQTLKELKPVGC